MELYIRGKVSTGALYIHREIRAFGSSKALPELNYALVRKGISGMAPAKGVLGQFSWA